MKNAKHNIIVQAPNIEHLSMNDRAILFAKGLSYEITTELSRYNSLDVIVSHQNEKENEPIIADYFIQGSVQDINNLFRTTIQLCSGDSKKIIWSESFTGPYEKFFDIEMNISKSINFFLQEHITNDYLHLSMHKKETDLNAYELWLQGHYLLQEGSLPTDEEARICFQKAIEIEPIFSRAYMGISLSYFNEWSCQLWSRWDVSKNGALEWALKAYDLNTYDHVCNAILGRIYTYNAEYEKAEHYLRRSLQLNNNDTETLSIIAISFTYLGYVNEALTLYERAKKLDPYNHFAEMGMFIFFELGEFNKSIMLANKHELASCWVDLPAYKAASYYHLGDDNNCKIEWETFLDFFSKRVNGEKKASHEMALKWMINVNPYKNNNSYLFAFWESINHTHVPLINTTINSRKNASFTIDGKFLHATFEDTSIQVPIKKGYRDIKRLLESPFMSIHCTELMDAKVIDSGTKIIDDQAKKAYKKELKKIEFDINEAQLIGDFEQIQQLEKTYETLINHLSTVSGIGGRIRSKSSGLDKCRSAVTWRIRDAIKALNTAYPALGQHFSNSIKTGMQCQYSPEFDISWKL